MLQPGLGAMIHYLKGGSQHSSEEYYGRKVYGVEFTEDYIRLTLDDGLKIEIRDDGQSCCERRYMTCDDDVSSLVGYQLTRIEAKPGPDVENDGDCHEQVFVEIATDRGFITIANHNEHNGYYGGFGLTIVELPRT